MSYIYSQALVEASSLANFLATEQSAPLSGSPLHRPCLWHDKTMEPFHLSRFGMTFKPLMEPYGGELLTSWRAAFPARIYQLQGGGQASMEPAAACGTTWPASLAKYDPITHSLKTAQLSLLEDLTGCLVTLPRSGLMRNGQCWERPMLGRSTRETGYGFSLPTPRASMHKNRRWWARKNPMGNLEELPSMYPEMYGHLAGQEINPQWLEWLMGWPIGQTHLKPLETAKYQEWQQQHSNF